MVLQSEFCSKVTSVLAKLQGSLPHRLRSKVGYATHETQHMRLPPRVRTPSLHVAASATTSVSSATAFASANSGFIASMEYSRKSYIYTAVIDSGARYMERAQTRSQRECA